MIRRPLADARARRGMLPTIVATVLALVVGIIAGPAVPAASALESAAAPAARSFGVTSSGLVKTADLTQFRPGTIISDAVFYNRNAMNEGQVQDFLNSQVRTCRSGYVCLKDKSDQTRWIAADPMCNTYQGGGVESAARIITKVAQACGINPQVLLVMLQKEQSLITDTYPYDSQYRIAMGQGCPDTSGCDSAYYGFFNQVYGAARQLRRYENPPGTSNFFTWYAPGRTWNILYHPPALVNGQWVDQCGSSPVYVENKATAALYYYTPYQPNAASLRAGAGEGDRCSSYGNRNFYRFFQDWFGSDTVAGSPIGNLESITSVPGGIQVKGWSIDPDTSDAIQVHVYVNGVGAVLMASRSRPDVKAAYPSAGANHGFDDRVPVSTGGSGDVCVYAVNVARGANVLLGCQTVPLYSGSPVGEIDSLSIASGRVSFTGWAIDPDTAQSLDIHAYVDGQGQSIPARRDRPDLAVHYPMHGTAHGFSETLTVPQAAKVLCLYAINVGPGENKTLGCRNIMAPASTDIGRTPIGNLEEVAVTGTTATIRGWAIDPDTTRPVAVHVYVGARGQQLTAASPRADVGAAYPPYGSAHGFTGVVDLPPGESDVCVYAINSHGENTTLGCRQVSSADAGRAPLGNFEEALVNGSSVKVRGWAIDPDTARPITVDIINRSGTTTSVLADRDRPDVAAAFPQYGGRHGFERSFDLPPGPSTICVRARNTAGPDTELGCRSVTTRDEGRLPIGNVEEINVVGTTARVKGWALDPDTARPIPVHIYTASRGHIVEAPLDRPDVGAAYPNYGAAHGFAATVDVPPGTSQICVYAINTSGPNPLLSCRQVTS